MSNRQLEHYEMDRERQTFPIVVLSDGIRLAKNIGALFRISEAFGVSELCIHGLDEKLPNKKFTRVARSTEKVLPYRVIEDIPAFFKDMKVEYTVVAIEITENSQTLQSFEFDSTKKYLFVVGAETQGVSEQVLDYCDHFLHINMFGLNSSMNVTSALSVALYEYSRQLA